MQLNRMPLSSTGALIGNFPKVLRRNLIYTAITRGKKLVVIIGQKKALAMAVKDTTSSHRYSKLREWLVA